MLLTDRAESPEAEPRVVTFTITPTRERPLSHERDSASAVFDVAHVYAGAITERIASGLKELGYVVHTNDAVGRDELRRALDAGAQSVSTNYVGLAISLIG